MIFLLLFGLLWMAMGMMPLLSLNEDRKRCTSETTGTIIDLYERQRLEDGVWCISQFPVVCFKAENGINYTFTSRISSETHAENNLVLFDFSKITGIKHMEVGTEVIVRYDPIDPTNAYIKKPSMSLIMPLMVVLIGLLGIIRGMK